jgi:glycosyltransferase involved in cell wall biosynthesis
MLMISIVVPNLNEERYLGKFLESLANQTFQDFELIIVDGGSSDGSRKIVDRFQELHPEMCIAKLINEKRNIGFIRNFGSSCARGELLFHTSSDVILDPWILYEVDNHFKRDPWLISLTGRTKPVASSILPHIAYQGFDLLRWFFSKLPGSLRKYRPGGNFFVIRKDVFDSLQGFPEVCINEDGLLGQKVDELLVKIPRKVKFDLGMCVHHHVKRFEERGSLRTILFYFYVFGNLFPMLKPFFYKIEGHSAEIFKSRSDLRDFR